MTKRNLFALFVLALCFGIGACGGGPTAPTPGPTITQLTVAPETAIVPAGSSRGFEVSDAEAKCTASRGKLLQSGSKLDYTAPEGFGGIDEIRCDKVGAQPTVAHVTISRQVLTQYSRPDGSGGGSVVLAYYVKGQFGWSEELCPTSGENTSAGFVWGCLKDLAPGGPYYVLAIDSRRGRVPDGVRVWGKEITTFTNPGFIPELNGARAAMYEITIDYNVK